MFATASCTNLIIFPNTNKPIYNGKKDKCITLFLHFCAVDFTTRILQHLSEIFPTCWQISVRYSFPFFSFYSLVFLLITQPILIKQQRIDLHRKFGKLSYVLAPILILTIIILAINQIQRELSLAENNAAVTAFIALIDILSFSTYFIIAMLNSKNLRWHVAFLVAATLVVLNPGLSRLLNQIEYGLGMLVAVLLPFVLSIFVICIERIKYKRPILRSPYFLYLCLWTITILMFATIPKTEFWINFVNSTFK